MKLLADESVEYPVVKALKEKGFDVVYVADFIPGSRDEDVFNHAVKEGRTLLTADKDFGELSFRMKRVSKGVILYRVCGMPNIEKAKLVVEALVAHLQEAENHFTVITKSQVGIKKYF